MKKLCILLAILLLIGLTACGEKPEPAPEPEPPVAETPAEPEQEPAEEEIPVEEEPAEEETPEEEPEEEETPAEAPAEDEKEVNPLYEQALALIDCSVEELYDTVGMPIDYMYADSCLGEGEDGELYYDGFTVYTYRDLEDNETIYDVMENMD